MSVPERRASDADRHQAVERLRTACVEGRIDLGEFGLRVERALVARAQEELGELVRDLPEPAAARPPERERRVWRVLPIGGFERRGRWRVPRRFLGIFLVGGLDLDFTEAELSGDGADFTVFALVGGADVRVPPGVHVEVAGFSVIGGHDVHVPEPSLPDAPRLRLRVYSLVGGVDVIGSRRELARA